MRCWIQFFYYQEPLLRPLQTHHGTWRVREGIYLRLQSDTGLLGFGEIAPLETFGSEPIGAAWTFCATLPYEITAEMIANIPEALPACQFGFSQAWQMLTAPPRPKPQPLPLCHLLPPGNEFLYQWPPNSGNYQAWKWKIGVLNPEIELEILRAFARKHPPDSQPIRLRLDANAGLTLPQAQAWLELCDRINTDYAQGKTALMIEFFEQPLAANDWTNHLALAQQFATPIAFDESVTTMAQLEAVMNAGWPGLVVIKPVIAGAWGQLEQTLRQYRERVILSSALEGPIGRLGILTLACKLNLTHYALGLGVDPWRPVAELETLNDIDNFWQLLEELTLHKS